MNNLDSFAESKNSQIIDSLNSRLINFFNDNKNYLVGKYISDMKSYMKINSDLNNNIFNIIEVILDGKRYIFENEYINMTDPCIKEPFFDEFKKILIEEKIDLFSLIEKNRESTRIKINALSTMEPDQTLSDIENKLNITLKAINDYNSHFNSFKISDSIKNYLEEFGKNIILPKYEKITSDIRQRAKPLIISNLDKNSKGFEDAYKSNQFQLKSEDIKNNLINDFKSINKSINDYGTIDSKYSDNLKKESEKYLRIRRLDDLNNDKIIYNQKVADFKIDTTFQELNDSFLMIQEFLKNVFSSFEDKINKFINQINNQKDVSQKIINDFEEEEINLRLNQLYNLSMNYYDNSNKSFYTIKENIINLFSNIYKQFETSANITYKHIADKYIEIKENFDQQIINKSIKYKAKIIKIPKYNDVINNYYIDSYVNDYSIENEFLLNVIFENDDIKKPKVVGKVVNKVNPKSFKIDFYSKLGKTCEKIGRKITPKFENISFITNINFDAGLNKIIINTNYNIDEYKIYTYFYKINKLSDNFVSENGVFIPFEEEEDDICKDPPPFHEKKEEIIPSRRDSINETYQF